MVLIIRHLPNLGYSAMDTEFITSVFTTWGVKFVTILTSVSTGLVISLIPNMVKDFTENNMEKVNLNYNKCIKIIMFIVAPLAIFISVMSNSVWNIFYGYNQYGPMIIKYTIPYVKDDRLQYTDRIILGFLLLLSDKGKNKEIFFSKEILEEMQIKELFQF